MFLFERNHKGIFQCWRGFVQKITENVMSNLRMPTVCQERKSYVLESACTPLATVLLLDFQLPRSPAA